MRDEHYVYHADSEPAPRATASGAQNIVGLGYVLNARYPTGFSPREFDGGDYPMRLPWQQQPGPGRLPPGSPGSVVPVRVCPAWGCNPPGSTFNYPGATATVPQPPPSSGGSQIVPLTSPLPLSPAPSPTVAVSPNQTAPQLTQPGSVLDSSGASITTASGIGMWLAQSNLISGIPNWGIAAGGLFLAMMLFGGKSGRR
jgi:hypothetical protein